jgi:formylglycine-generating enzyme required for sulfatase activity/predicted esterase
MSLFSELKRRKVFRVAAGYVVSAWVLIQVVETIFPAFGLDDAAFRLLVIALAIGFIPAVILAWAFELTRTGLVRDRHTPGDDTQGVAGVLKQPRYAVPLGIAVIAAAGTIVALAMQLQEFRSARIELLPRIEALAEQGDVVVAFELALQAEQVLPEDPVLQGLIEQVAVTMSFVTDPPGADVYYRRYSEAGDNWQLLGTTPIDDVRLPRAVSVWRIEKPGYEVAQRSGEPFDGTYQVSLVEGELAAGLVRVPTAERFFLLTGYVLRTFEVPTFLAQRHEVSNAEYAEFVRNGGYENPDYWSHLSFVNDGEAIGWEEATDSFRDATGRYGPATWEGGTFPEGAGQFPVTGISWFEAAAYARYRGMALPTIQQWSSMTIFPAQHEIETDSDSRPGYGLYRSELAALSNFSEQGPAEVGSNPGLAPFGTLDAAGNVREWCWNATGDAADSERYILGGSWRDPTYLYTYGIAESPWDRSDINGVRLVSNESATAALREPMPLPDRETIAPVSDEVFAVYRDLFDHDPSPLNAVVESTDAQSAHWVQETISLDAAYDGERLLAHVFLPKNIEPPYQVVMYYPSSDAIYRLDSDGLELDFVDFIVKSGRALVYPVLWGTYERNVGLDTTWPKNTREYSDNVVKWIQDFRRTVDYLEMRSDLDLDKLGFYGFSWGGWNGPVVMALDDRFKTGVYLSGGIPPTLARPEASSASYASRVTQPVLMISGKDDVIRPVATYQAPMFESLGTPAADKRHAILEGGHLPPWEAVVAEALDWFDRYLGPTE